MGGNSDGRQAGSQTIREWLKDIGMPVMAALLLACIPLTVGCTSEKEAAHNTKIIESQTYDDGLLRWDIAKVDGHWFWLCGGDGSSSSEYDTITYMRCEDGAIRASYTYATALEFAFDAEEGGDGWATKDGTILTLHLPPSAAE